MGGAGELGDGAVEELLAHESSAEVVETRGFDGGGLRLLGVESGGDGDEEAEADVTCGSCRGGVAIGKELHGFSRWRLGVGGHG